MRSTDGLTLIEVLAAIAILGIIIAVFSSSFISSMSVTRAMGNQTDANTVLSFFGRMASGGAGRSLGFSPTAGSLSYTYGQLEASFPELASADAHVKDANLYQVSITSPGTIDVGIVRLYQYDIEVCWQDRNQDRCISGLTAGPLGSPAGGVVN